MQNCSFFWPFLIVLGYDSTILKLFTKLRFQRQTEIDPEQCNSIARDI